MPVLYRYTHMFSNKIVIIVCTTTFLCPPRRNTCGICGDMNGNEEDDNENGNSAKTCRKWRAPTPEEDRCVFLKSSPSNCISMIL